MNLDLSKYSDKEILEAMSKLGITKIIAIMTAFSKISERATARGNFLANAVTEENIDELFKKLMEGEKS